MNTETVALATPTLTLEQVAVHFEDWRRQKRRGDRIPEQLCSEAIALVESDGLWQVTRRLRLSGRDSTDVAASSAAAAADAGGVPGRQRRSSSSPLRGLCKRSAGRPQKVAWS
jgi:hypothetical protein